MRCGVCTIKRQLAGNILHISIFNISGNVFFHVHPGTRQVNVILTAITQSLKTTCQLRPCLTFPSLTDQHVEFAGSTPCSNTLFAVDTKPQSAWQRFLQTLRTTPTTYICAYGVLPSYPMIPVYVWSVNELPYDPGGQPLHPILAAKHHN